MRVMRARNVNGLFYDGMHLLDEYGEQTRSRAGAVVVAPWPVTSVYESPTERVLFCPKRDANPFFHLMEGLWMLSGRNDSSFLNRYVANFGERFAESASGRSGAEASGVIHDAYGHRWRSAMGFDQLDAIVARLRKDSSDRQCVLQMWDGRPRHGEDDEMLPGRVGQDDLLGDWRTRPCNTHAYFRVRQRDPRSVGIDVNNMNPDGSDHNLMNAIETTAELDMTILCRSNDAIWGAHGANAVHFSMLQEYLAGRIGVQVGTMYQVSNNYHGYETELARVGAPEFLDGDDPYENGEVEVMPMGTDWKAWDDDLRFFMEWHDKKLPDEQHMGDFLEPLYLGVKNKWFADVAGRVALVRWQWTHGARTSAVVGAEQIAAPDWRRACLEWMDRREKKA